MKSDAMKRAFAVNGALAFVLLQTVEAQITPERSEPLTSAPFAGKTSETPSQPLSRSANGLTCAVLKPRSSHLVIASLSPFSTASAPLRWKTTTGKKSACVDPCSARDADSQNFMKCLMRMYAKENKGVLFYETILSFRQQRHTYIEAVPLPYALWQDAPAYFRVSCARPA